MSHKHFTIEEINTKLISKELTVAQLVDAYLSTISEKNDELNVFIKIHKKLLKQEKMYY